MCCKVYVVFCFAMIITSMAAEMEQNMCKKEERIDSIKIASNKFEFVVVFLLGITIGITIGVVFTKKALTTNVAKASDTDSEVDNTAKKKTTKVHVFRTGKSYHCSGCTSSQLEKNARLYPPTEMTIPEAEAKKKMPCRCHTCEKEFRPLLSWVEAWVVWTTWIAQMQ